VKLGFVCACQKFERELDIFNITMMRHQADVLVGNLCFSQFDSHCCVLCLAFISDCISSSSSSSSSSSFTPHLMAWTTWQHSSVNLKTPIRPPLNIVATLSSIIQITTVIQPLQVLVAPLVKTYGFCVLLPACPCWRQPDHFVCYCLYKEIKNIRYIVIIMSI